MSSTRDTLLRLAMRLTANRHVSRGMGVMADLRAPRVVLDRVIDTYCRTFNISLDDSVVPQGGFQTFNAFFTRHLKPGARPVAQKRDVLVSPADGHIQAFGQVSSGMLVQAKGQNYALETLMGSGDDARRYEGGWFATVYLSPRDYHRVHAPCDGTLLDCVYMPGRLFTVSPIASRLVDGLLPQNERVALRLRGEWGCVGVVLVGAIGVGHITLAHVDLETNRGRSCESRAVNPPIECRKGDELGVFNLGSTVVLLVEGDGWEGVAPPVGAAVRMGQPLFCRSRAVR